MKKILGICVGAVLSGLATASVAGDLVVSKDKVIDTPETISFDSGVIQNFGVINSGIFINPGNMVQIQNAGEINGSVDIYKSTTYLTQVVYGPADMNFINVNNYDSDGYAHFNIMAQSASGVDFGGLELLSGGRAEKIIIKDSIITFDLSAAPSNTFTEFQGENVLFIKNAEPGNFLLLSNASIDSGGSVIARTDQLGLYVPETTFDNGKLYLNIVRDYDYQKIIGSDFGTKINIIRASDPSNRTVNALDSAKTQSDIDRIIKNSAMFTPINLTKDLEIINKLYNLGNGVGDISMTGRASYVTGPNVKAEIGEFGTSFIFQDIELSVSGMLGKIEHNSDYDEYSAFVYGGAIDTKYNFKPMWLALGGAYTIAQFETGVIFEGENETRNPNGSSLFNYIEIGSRFGFDEFYIEPSVGAGFIHSDVLSYTKQDLFEKSKLVIGTKYDDNDGFRYNHGVFIGNTGDDIVFGANFYMQSIEDVAKVGFVYTGLNTDHRIYHKLGIEFSAEF